MHQAFGPPNRCPGALGAGYVMHWLANHTWGNRVFLRRIRPLEFVGSASQIKRFAIEHWQNDRISCMNTTMTAIGPDSADSVILQWPPHRNTQAPPAEFTTFCCSPPLSPHFPSRPCSRRHPRRSVGCHPPQVLVERSGMTGIHFHFQS